MAGQKVTTAILEIRTDTGAFFADLSKAEQRGLSLGSVFERVGKFFASFSRDASSAGQSIERMSRQAETGGKSATLAIEGWGVSFGKLVASYVSAQAIIAGASAAWGLIVGAVKSSITAANEAERSTVQLVAALKAQGTATPSVVAAIQGYASALQKTTIYQDDALEGAAALLVTVGNVMPRDMKKALEATTNLASGLGVDLHAATLMVAKAAEGNTTALKKAGVTIDETAAKAGGFGVVLDKITEKFGGQAAAIAGTYEGRLAQLANTWNNVEESVGRAVTQNRTVLELLDRVNTSIDTNTGELKDNAAAMNFLSDAVILAVRGVGLLALSLDTVQTWMAGFVITIRDGAAALGNIGLMIAKVAQASALLHGDQAAYNMATAGVKAFEEAVAELGRRNEATTQRSAALGTILQVIGAKADALATDLAKTRGQTVALTTATDAGTDAWSRHTKAAGETSEVLKSFAKAVAELQEKLGLAARSGAPLSEVIRLLGAEAFAVVEKASLMPGAFAKLPPAIRDIGLAWNKAELKKEMDKWAESVQKAIGTWVDFSHEIEKRTKIIADAIISTAQIEADAQRKADDEIAASTLSTFDLERRTVILWAQDQRRILEASGVDWSRAWAAVTKVVELSLTRIDAKEKDTFRQIGQNAKSSTASWAASLEVLATTFTQLATIGGDSFGKIARDAGTMIVALKQVASATEAVKDSIKQSAEAGGSGIASAASIAALTGSYITLLFAVFQIVDALLKQHESNKIARADAEQLLTIYREFPGVSAGVAKSIMEMAKVPGSPVADANRKYQEALALADIVRDLGGVSKLTAGALALVADRVGLLFDIIASKGPDAQKAITALDGTLVSMAESAVHNGGLVSQMFLDMVAKAKAAGVELAGVNAFLKGQFEHVASGFNAVAAAMIGPMNTAVATLTTSGDDLVLAQEKVAKIQGQIDDMMAHGGPKTNSQSAQLSSWIRQLADAQTAVADLTGKNKAAADAFADYAKNGQDAFDRTGRLAVAAFSAAMASGKGFMEALDSIGPGLDDLQQAMSHFGFTSSTTLDQLLQFRKFAQDNKELAAGIDGLNQMLQGLANTGMLDQATFDDLSATAEDMYKKMIAGGLSSKQAMVALRPTLQTIWQLHKDTGMAVDDATQALLDEAEANGLVGDQMRDVNDKMLMVLVAIAKVLGADLPAAFDKAKKGAESAADGVNDAIDKLPKKIDIPIDFPMPGAPGGRVPLPTPDYSHDWDPSTWHRGEYGGAQALGGDYLVRRPTLFMAGEAGPERATFTPGATPGESGGDIYKTYNVTITARDHDAAENWRDWMRRDGVEIVVEEFEDKRYVSRVNHALAR